MPNEEFRRSARIRGIVERATKSSQHPKEDQAPLGRSQVTKNRAPKPLVKAARGTKITSQSKEAVDPSLTKGELSVQSQKSRAAPGGREAVAAPRLHLRKKAPGRPKSIADPIEPKRHDLASGTQTHFSGTSKHKTRRPRGETNQARGRRPKAHLTLAAEYSSLPISSPQAALNGESQSRLLQGQSGLSNQPPALTREALEAHTCETAPIAFVDKGYQAH